MRVANRAGQWYAISMKDVLVSVDNAGRLVLPKQIREDLAIHPGDQLKIAVEGDHVTLRPERQKAGFIKKGEVLVFSTGGTGTLTDDALESICNSDRLNIVRDISKGLPAKHK